MESGSLLWLVGALAARFSLLELVNDGLMTLFLFVVGMEIKRELALGELRTLPQAILPAIAALGGMIVPAGIFLAFNGGRPGAAGWGIGRHPRWLGHLGSRGAAVLRFTARSGAPQRVPAVPVGTRESEA